VLNLSKNCIRTVDGLDGLRSLNTLNIGECNAALHFKPTSTR
jgi:hypothetical protein